MKLIVLKTNLREGLNIIGKINPEAPSLPILKNFLLEIVDNQIKISTTNLELAITGYVSGKIIENGGLTIPLNIFSAIINNLQSERIELETEKDNLIIKTENYEAKLQGIKKDDFPLLPKVENSENFIEIQNSIFKKTLALVISAAQASSARPVLNSVLLDFQTSFMKLAATDGFRLAEQTINENYYKTNLEKNIKLVIPLKTIQELIRIIQDEESGNVRIYFDNNLIIFKNDKYEVVSRLINEEFPNYDPIIPKVINTEIIINKNQLINALKLTGVFSDRLNEVKINIPKELKNIEIYSSNSFVGENKYLIPAKIKGEALEIVFNWRFIMDGIKNLETENVFMGLASDKSPALIKPADDPNYFYIVMPIKT